MPLVALLNLHAQELHSGAELWGRVFLSGDTIGLPGVSVELVGVAGSTTTSGTGFYRLAGLTPGPHVLRVRRLGYQSVTLDVDLQDDRALRRDIRLEQLPTTLTEVRIEGVLRKVPPRFDDVYRRMAIANGKFFTREDIDRLHPPDIQSLLMQVGTVNVNSRGITFERCNGSGALLLSPGGGKVQIYIDGYRMTGRAGSAAPGDPIDAEQREVLRMVNPSQIQAIEIYSGVSRIPGVFLEDACAVIAIWTRSY
jgi:Carboxypeptidase regulatory-like domain/TonB-dependent Receptor Plug Domain